MSSLLRNSLSISLAAALLCLPAHSQPQSDPLPSLPKNDPKALNFLTTAAKSHLFIKRAYVEDVGQVKFAKKSATYKVSLWFDRPNQFRIESHHGDFERYVCDGKTLFVDEPLRSKHHPPKTIPLAKYSVAEATKVVCERNGDVLHYLLRGATQVADYQPRSGDTSRRATTFLPDATINGHPCRRVATEEIYGNPTAGIEPTYFRTVAWFDKKTLNLQAYDLTSRGPGVHVDSRDTVTYHISPKPFPPDTFKVPVK